MLKTLSNPSNLSLVHVSKTCMCYNQMNTPTHAGLVNTYKKPPPLHPSAPQIGRATRLNSSHL